MMTWASHVVTFGSAVLVLPLILKNFSKEEIAVWFVFAAVFNIVQLADAGFGPNLVRAVSYFHAGVDSLPNSYTDYVSQSAAAPASTSKSSNNAKLIALYVTSKTIYFVLIGGSVLVLSLVGTFLVRNVIRLAGSPPDLWASYAVLVVTGAVTVALTRWASLLQGLNRIASLRRYETVTGAIRIAGSIALLLLGQRILALVILGLSVTVIQYLLVRRDVLRWFTSEVKGFNPREMGFDSALFHNLWPSTWRMGLLACGSFMVSYGSGIVVSQIADTALIAGYLVTLRIVSLIRQIAQTPFYARLPDLFRLFAQFRLRDVRALVSTAIAASLFLMVAAFVGVGITGNPVFAALHFNTRILAGVSYVLLCVTMMLEMHHSMHSQIYMATNDVPFVVPSLISGGLIVVLGGAVVGRFGLLGLLGVQFVVQVAFSNWYPVLLSLRLLQWPVRDYVRDLLHGATHVLSYRLQIPR